MEDRPDAPQADARAELAVEIVGLHKWYGDFHVLRDINLTVARGERIVICGPSGSGKSTLIRCINRLEELAARPHRRRRHRTDRRPEEHRRSAPRRRHGVPAFQPVPASDRSGELHAGADLGAARCRKKEAEELAMHYLDARRKFPSRRNKYPGAAVRRPAAARRDRPRAVHEPERSCCSTSRPRRSIRKWSRKCSTRWWRSPTTA